MKPDGGGEPSGDLLELIKRDFGSFERFVEEFKLAASTQFGSGWAWLACEWFYPQHHCISYCFFFVYQSNPILLATFCTN